VAEGKLDGQAHHLPHPGEPFRYFAVPAHRVVMPMVGRWVTRTEQAASQLAGIEFAAI